ncbi:MAG: hypothetical protein VKN13_07545, partial [Cyanobacteriota bacterium]|nr:hypothetical protein [Cyanobacteriota bacterium]
HSTFSSAAADFLTNFYGSGRFGGQVNFNLSLPYDPPNQPVTLAWEPGRAQHLRLASRAFGAAFISSMAILKACGSAAPSAVKSTTNSVPSRVECPSILVVTDERPRVVLFS